MSEFFNKLWDILVVIMDFFIRKLFRIKLSEEQWQNFLQFVKFGIVGVSNNLVYYAFYLPLLYAIPSTKIAGTELNYLVAHTVAFFTSVVNAFYWNNKYVFKGEEGSVRSPWKAFLKTLISYGCTNYILEAGLLFVWVQYLHVPKAIAPLITLLITIPANYLLNKFWAFKDKKKD